jgi:hypothetical protein
VNSGGVFFAIENQVFEVDSVTGDAALSVTVGGKIEAFAQNGDSFLVCESGGAYHFFYEGVSQTYQSDYICHFPVLGNDFALTGSYDAKSVRILRREDFSEANVLTYDSAYDFTEAKIHPINERAVFYSYAGMRLCDLSGNLLAETEFPNPQDVLNTEYDETSGNVAVIYADIFRLYSGLDGTLLIEAKGKSAQSREDASVLYTDFGVSVLEENGTASLYDLASGVAISYGQTEMTASNAIPVCGGLVFEKDNLVYFDTDGQAPFDGHELATGKIIGVQQSGENSYNIAIADDANGKVFTLDNNGPTERFSFTTRGRSEAYFCGGFMFLSPLHGGAAAYSMDGKLTRAFEEKGYLADVQELGDSIAANYVSSDKKRYTFLLRRDTLESVAELPGFLGTRESSELVFDVGGALRVRKLLSLNELVSLAKARLSGEAFLQ